MGKTPRNSRCPCGSRKKYKKCCGSAAITNVNDFFDTPAGRRIVEKAVEMMHPAPPSRMVSRPQMQTVAFGQKLRAVRNAVHFRPLEETFHDFQLNLLLGTLGKNWFEEQMLKPRGKRHIILRWRDERNALLEKHRDPAAPLNEPVRAPLTGNMKALQVLADDIYQLQHALKTPRKIVERLRNMREFQGARYEVLVASLFARCGFDIEFVDDGAKKNPEFFATKAGERIAVEAKSRHRPGVLHESGEYLAELEPGPARIRGLFQEALEQNPRGRVLLAAHSHLPIRTEAMIYFPIRMGFKWRPPMGSKVKIFGFTETGQTEIFNRAAIQSALQRISLRKIAQQTAANC